VRKHKVSTVVLSSQTSTTIGPIIITSRAKGEEKRPERICRLSSERRFYPLTGKSNIVQRALQVVIDPTRSMTKI